MTKVIHLKKIPKISDLFTDFYETAAPVYKWDVSANAEERIETAALDFLTDKCGKVWQDVTDDSNLNAELINLFAQDFVRQFWNNRIAFDDETIFFVKLRSFLDQWLPVWGQFYREAILAKSAFITNAGQVSTNSNGLLHVEGLNSNESKNTGNSTSQTTGTTSSVTDGKTSSNSNGTNSTTGTTSSDQKTTGTDTTTHNTTTDTQSMSVNADQPQDVINAENFAKTGKDGAKPLSGYNWEYASSTGGKHDAQTVTGTDSTEHNTDVATTGNSKQDVTNQESTIGTSHSETKGTSDSTTTSSTTGNTSSKGTNNSDQRSSNAGVTTTKARNASIASLAEQFDSFANGAYMMLFLKAKKSGIFLGVY